MRSDWTNTYTSINSTGTRGCIRSDTIVFGSDRHKGESQCRCPLSNNCKFTCDLMVPYSGGIASRTLPASVTYNSRR
jgi:hypothetical protein